MSNSAGQQLPSEQTVYTGSTLLHVSIVFIVLEIFFVGLWYIATYLKHRRIGLDDIFIPLALVCSLVICIICIILVKKCYVGYHISWVLENHPTAVITYYKIQAPYNIFYFLACTFSKLAILSLYLRIFTAKRDRITSYALIGVQTLWCISCTVTNFVQCIPLAYLWNPTAYPDGHCINIYGGFWKWGWFPNILTDVPMLLLPLPCILKLKLSKKEKIGLVLTFCTGSIGLVTSIVRFALVYQILEDNQADYTFASINGSRLLILESGFYLIAACLPNYRSLFREIRAHTTIGTRSSSYGASGRPIFLKTKHTKTFGSGNEISHLDNEGKNLTTQGNFVESCLEVAGSINSNTDIPIGEIQVQQDYIVGSSHV